MSSAELLTAYSEQAQNFYTVLGLLITFVSAYIVATYLAGDRLSWAQFTALSAMFCLVCFDLAQGLHIFGETMYSLASELERRSLSQTELSFLVLQPWSNYVPRGPQIFWVMATVVSVGFATYRKYRGTA